MTSASFIELSEPGTRLLPLHVDQYHDMIDKGILEEGTPCELLDGVLVPKDRSGCGEDPMTISYDHALTVKKLAKLSRQFERLGCHVQTQQPVTLPPHDEPEPDAAVIVGALEDYHGRHPSPKDVLCVVEVSDASLHDDRTRKLRIYADAGIPQYVIVNLPDRVVEVYTQPLVGKGRYGQSVTLGPSQTVALRAARGRELRIAVRRLLP